MVIPLDRLRIVIALAVLKNTPADQSPSTFILSLQDRFPSSEAPSLNFWKGHAHRLEKECVELRAALGKLQIHTFIEANASSTQPAEDSEKTIPSNTANTSLLATKKKTKKKIDPTSELEVVHLADVLKSGRVGIRLGRPFEAMDTFLQLCSLSDRPGFQRKAFFMAIRDVCKAISSAFDDAIKNLAKLRTLQTIQAIIRAVIDKAVPLAFSWVTENEEVLSLLFDNLLELFINPIIPVFMVISERSLAYMRKRSSATSEHPSPSTQPPSASADFVDSRVASLAMLQMIFSHIQSTLSISAKRFSGGKDSNFGLACADFSVMIRLLILTIVRHLRDILRDGDSAHKQTPRRRRIKRLAVKDTLWYLCSAVHFLLDLHDLISVGTKSFPRQKQRLQLLMDTTLDIMMDLLLYQDRKRVLDYTQRHHLTAKTVVRASVESQKLPPPLAASDEQAMNYFVLDDFEYRMFLCLVQRILGVPMP